MVYDLAHRCILIKRIKKKQSLLKFTIMKFQSNQLLETLTNEEIATMTTEVKETLVPGFKELNKKIFSAAQLWDIYRRRHNTFGRRLY